MTTTSMRSIGAAAVGTPARFEPPRRDFIDTSDLPHPPYRVPFLGDVLGLNPRIPFQSSLPQTRKLGPISARKMLGTEMGAASGLTWAPEGHTETRFARHVGRHLT